MLPQVPLLYVFMSEKRETIDYVKILKYILSLLDHQTAVETVVTDFERATWRAFEHVFPNVKLIGCAFHWTQALFRNLKKIGLVRLYRSNSKVKLKKKAAKLKIGLLDKFFAYKDNTWMQPGIWSPEAWSVFFQFIRTNNDAEGWHNKLNKKGKGTGLHFYKLVQMLFLESEFVEVKEAYLKQHQTTRTTRLDNKLIQAKLFKLWESYEKKREKNDVIVAEDDEDGED
uniref:MULE transposase domain-containing protein n=1 Tax=Daphnia galeata TaxID=27404 RepID=A0A8J2RNV4_9CRUS|nr:unnamed protein product [Daphnia galeata]